MMSPTVARPRVGVPPRARSSWAPRRWASVRRSAVPVRCRPPALTMTRQRPLGSWRRCIGLGVFRAEEVPFLLEEIERAIVIAFCGNEDSAGGGKVAFQPINLVACRPKAVLRLVMGRTQIND